MRIVLCDSNSINSYGFKTDVVGIDLTRFNKNPVMLYNHDPERIIGRWEHVKADGTQLIGEPVFDMEDPFAAEIARKVEQGFIKGCSMGLVIKNISQSKGIDIATNSVLIEASIVGIPSDENALVVYDNEDNKKKLSINDFNKLFYKMDTQKNNKPIVNSQFTIDNLQAELAAKTDIIADLTTQVNMLKKDLAEREFHEAEQAVDNAVKEGIIPANVKNIVLAFYLDKPEDTKELLGSLSMKLTEKKQNEVSKEQVENQVTLSSLIKQEPKVERSWDELDKAGELKRLKEINPEEFRKLFFEKFGKEYVG
ncbi:MAG: HK97 family phage prohead protease [Bacteroidales bacterium]|nr:HK97 family phage prohead protease [Bacteroidales bacterium]